MSAEFDHGVVRLATGSAGRTRQATMRFGLLEAWLLPNTFVKLQIAEEIRLRLAAAMAAVALFVPVGIILRRNAPGPAGVSLLLAAAIPVAGLVAAELTFGEPVRLLFAGLAGIFGWLLGARSPGAEPRR